MSKACPLCRQPLQYVSDGLVGRAYVAPYSVIGRKTNLITRLFFVPFWACSACEHCEEARPGARPPAGPS
jgi:uncharacterized protein YbaR (Trm112 family)